jgi:secreted PhoX family phosphatase
LGGRPDLGSGTLEIAIVQDLPAVLAGGSSAVSWATIPNPAPSSSQTSTRKQVAGATRFYRGEGAWYANGLIYFATTGRSSQPWQQRIWAYEVATDSLSLVYDRDTFGPGGVLTKPDNLTISPGGDVVVAEDGGDMQIVAITPAGNLVPLVQVVGHNGSEIAGPVFDPSGTRLYFSSQRGPDTDPDDRGITYEVTGPFFA